MSTLCIYEQATELDLGMTTTSMVQTTADFDQASKVDFDTYKEKLVQLVIIYFESLGANFDGEIIVDFDTHKDKLQQHVIISYLHSVSVMLVIEF